MPFFDRPWALLLVLAIILIIWGPGKLPEVGAAIGRAMREFRRSSSELTDEIRRSADQKSTPTVSSASDYSTSGDGKPSSTAASDVKPPTDSKA